MFEKVLVTVDGSEHSDRAVDLAADLATHYGGEVTLIHVVHDPVGRVPKGLEEFARLEHVHVTERDLLSSAGHSILSRARSRIHDDGARGVNEVVEFGHPAATIVEYAERHLAPTDIIVMGRRGLGNVTGAILGSVSHRVSHLAGCAVLTVQ
jgi:nucleotide-binding universal stress UspA family protein